MASGPRHGLQRHGDGGDGDPGGDDGDRCGGRADHRDHHHGGGGVPGNDSERVRGAGNGRGRLPADHGQRTVSAGHAVCAARRERGRGSLRRGSGRAFLRRAERGAGHVFLHVLRAGRGDREEAVYIYEQRRRAAGRAGVAVHPEHGNEPPAEPCDGARPFPHDGRGRL